MSASTKSPLGLGFEDIDDTEEARGPGLLARVGRALRNRADTWFPDRQILIRGPGNVSALHLPQRAQLLGAAAIAAILAALAGTSIGIVVACRAEARSAHASARLQAQLASVQAANAAERLAYQKAAEQRDIAVAQAVRARDIAVAQANHTRDAAVAAARAARDLAVARADSVVTDSNLALDGLIKQTQSTVGQVETVIKSTGLNPDELARQAVTVNTAPVGTAPVGTAPVGTAPAGPYLDAAGTGLSAAGLPAEGLPANGLPVVITPAGPAAGASALNPPVASLAVPTGLPEDAARRAALLVADLKRLQALGTVLAQMPLSSPTAQAIVSSGFGMRADPFTGAPEFHVGIDLPGPVGAPVYATAPGVVVFAGVSTGYGNLVTIDHGYGLSTRYSHLDKILVKVGSQVTLHQEIGLMGNTGWSTGPHLLYETRVDGQPQNPLNFIKVNPYDVQN